MSNCKLRVLLIDCGSRKFDDLCALTSAGGHAWDRLALDRAATLRDWPWDAIVISGGPHLFTDPVQAPELRRSFAFLDGPTPPVFGVCLGFQALVLAAGGEIFRGPERRTTDRIEFAGSHPLLVGLDSGTEFREDHCEGVRLPPGMRCLGHSEHYPVEIGADEARRRYGVQFHPEISGEPGLRIVRNFFAGISPRQTGG